MRLRLFTDYHGLGLSGFAQANARMIIFVVVPRILILSKSIYFTNGCTIYLFSSTLKYTLKFLLHVSV